MLRTLAKGIGANAFGQVVLIVLQLVQVPVLAAQWGLERYGLWIMLATIPNYLAISDLGFGKAAVTDMTMRVACGDRDGALKVYQSATLAVYAITLTILAILLGVGTMLPSSIFGTSSTPEDARHTLLILSIYGMASLAGGASNSGPLQATGNYATEATTWAVIWAAEGAAVIATVALNGSMTAVALALLLTRITGLLFLNRLARRHAPWLTLGFAHAGISEIRHLARPALATMVLPLANACVLQGTTMAVGLVSSPAAVPAFAVTRTLSRLPMQISGIVVRATMPQFSAATGRKDKPLQIKLIALALVTSAALLFPASLVLLIGGRQIVSLWTHGVVQVPVGLMVTMVIVLIANGLWVPLSNLVIATNRQEQFAYVFLAMSAISVLLAWILSARLGALGGALAMISVDLSMLVLMLLLIQRSFGSLSEIARILPVSAGILATRLQAIRQRP